MAVHSGICTCLVLLLFAIHHNVSAQDEDNTGLLESSGPSPEYTAASIVTNLWLGAFAVTSAFFGILGLVVALQWPNPKILCYKTSYSDIPSNSGRSCCSLYSLNLGFSVFYLLVFAIMVVARDILRIIVCLSAAIGHMAVVVVFRMKFKRFGRPERPYSTQAVAPSSSATSPTMLGPRQALGIPIYNIPMQTVVIGAPADSNTTSSSGNQPHNSSFWDDAACMPPQQHGGMPDMRPQQASTGAAAGSPAPYAAGPNVAVPAGVVPYPPQPPAYAEYARYFQPQLAAGTAVGVAVPAAALGTTSQAAGAAGSLGVSTATGGAAAEQSAQQVGSR